MTINQGTPVINTSHSTSGSQSFTIPTGYNAVLVIMPGYYRASTTATFTKLNWTNAAGVNHFTSIVSNASTTDPYDVFAYWMKSDDANWPGAGTHTLYWTFNAAPTEGGSVVIHALQNAGAVVDTDIAKGFTSFTSALSGISATDLSFLVIGNYFEETTTGYTSNSQTSLTSGSNDNSVDWGISYKFNEDGMVATSSNGFDGPYSGAVVFAISEASGPTYTLTAAQGSFTLSGQATNLLASRLLTAVQGSFSLAGQAANLLQNRLLTAAHGEFVLSGQDANLLASRLLTAEQGDFILSGQDVNLTVSRLLTASQGSFALSGQDTGLFVSRLLTAVYGSFVLSGQDVTLTYNPVGGYTLTAESGSFTLSGQAANLLTSRLLTAAQGSFSLSGQAANLTVSRLLTASQGSFALSGQDASLLVSRLLTAVYGAFALSGQDVTLTYNPVGSYTLTAESGSFTLSGQAANLLTSRLLTTAYGAFILSGQDVGLLRAFNLAAGQGAFTLSGQDANLLASRLLTAVYGSFVLSGQSATFDYSGVVLQIYLATVLAQLSPSFTVAANPLPSADVPIATPSREVQIG